MKRIIIIGSLVSCALLALTGEVQAQNGIEQVLKNIEANNKELQANAQLITSQKLEAKTDNNLPDPTLSYAHLWGAKDKNETIGELVVSQSFDFPSLYATRNKLNRLKAGAFDSQADVFRQEKLLLAKEVCLDIIMLRQQKHILEERLRNAEELAKMYAKRLQTGDANALETNKINLETDVENYGWKLHGVIDKAALESNVNKMYSKAMILYLCAILAVMGIAILIIKSILKPVSVISTSIDRVKTGDMQGYISIEGTNEIWQLAREYNEMLCSIQEANVKVEEQHGEIIESMKMKRRAEREALESQINAHFICNTLNAINYEAMDNGDFKVSLLLKKLSNILRYTFDQKHQNVYMFQEISWIEQYLFLQKERMGSAFDYEIQFDSDYDNWPCRKLMLQPFVENSILHGLEGVNKGGFIRITGEGYQEYLKIVIEDNGCGMTPEVEQIIKEVLENPLLAKQKGLGIGISNVVTRMRMYYTEDLKIQLETEERKGCKFTMILPEARQ